MLYQIELLEQIRDILWQNNIATWLGSSFGLAAFVISLVALRRSGK